MLRLRLQYKDKVIHEIRSTDITQEILIGRSSSCAWLVPKEDMVVGSHHASLELRGRDVWLRDKGSKNGTWHQGKRIDQRKLRSGDHITMGHTVLVVDEDRETPAGQSTAEVEIMTGKQRNQRKPIQGAQFSIGSDPNADLLFLEDLVSREHAVIVRKEDGGFWLKDLGSTNGTKVNDIPLRAQQERLLKDGDHVAIAHMQFVFHDGTGPRDQGKALWRLVIMAITACIAIGLYVIYQHGKPSAHRYIKSAREQAIEGRFVEARKALDNAKGARNYEEVHGEYLLLLVQIQRWETASKHWGQIQQLLKEQNWPKAATELGGLLSSNNDSWGWNKGSEIQQYAQRVKRLLDAYLDASHTDGTQPEVESRANVLATAIKEMESQKELDNLLKAGRERLKMVQDLVGSYARLNRELKALETWDPQPPDVGKVLSAVESIAKSTDGGLRQAAEKVLQPLRLLTVAYTDLAKTVQLVCNLQFKEAIEYKVNLPTSDACVIDPRLSVLRTNIENSYNNLKAQARAVQVLTEALSKQVETVNAVPSAMRFWGDAASTEKVLSCDSLNGPYPRRTRTEPQGEYDHAVCIESFYSSVRNITTEGTDNYARPPFEDCILYKTINIIGASKAMTAFFSDPERQWLLSGQLKQRAETANRILTLRDSITADLLKVAAESSGRKAVIAAGIAWHLMDKPEKARIGDQTLKEWLAAKLTGVRRDVEALIQERASADGLPEKRIALRNRILEVGMPGDRDVNEMWVDKSEAAASNR